APTAGVNFSVPVAGSMVGCTANSSGLSADTVKVRVWPASSAGPRDMVVAQPVTLCAPASDATVTFGPPVNDGASLTGATVTARGVSTDSPPLSVARTVSVAVPLAFGV